MAKFPWEEYDELGPDAPPWQEYARQPQSRQQPPHPNVANPLQRFEDPFNLGKPSDYVPPWLQNFLDQHLGTKEQQPTPLDVIGEMGKGVPIAGHYLPQTEGMTQFEQTFPKASTAARISGGTLATAPIAAAGIGRNAGFIKNLLTQGGINTGLNDADTVARKLATGEGFDWNKDVGEYAKNLAFGFGTGGLSAGLAKIHSPARPPTSPPRAPMSAEQQAVLSAQSDIQQEINNILKETLGEEAYKTINPTGKAFTVPYTEPQLPPGPHTLTPAATAGAAAGAATPTGVPSATAVPPWLVNITGPGPLAALGFKLGGTHGAEIGGFTGLGTQHALEQIARTPKGVQWLTRQAGNQAHNQALINALIYNTGHNVLPGITMQDSSEDNSNDQ